MISKMLIFCLFPMTFVLAGPHNQPAVPNGGGKTLSNLMPAPGVCGIDNNNHIYGGEITRLDEFPWMALIEYSRSNILEGFYCVGALINDRYVLTSAHCVLQQLKLDVSSVRLGEWDTDSDTDCDRGDCSDPPLDVPVEEIIPHESYNRSSKTHEHDIALLRLSKSVTYTDFIKPICLPTSETLRNANYDDMYLKVVSWGRTVNASFGNFKRGVSVSEVSDQECQKLYSGRVTIVPGQLCARRVDGEASCLVSGHLMTVDRNNPTREYWYSAGIVSFAASSCGMERLPDIFTRVSAYTDWILSKVRA